MNQNTVTGDYININLRQLGATSIKEFNSIMHIAEFDLGDGLIVSYVFNITRHNKYFLQRMQPYAMVHGKFASDQEIIDFIDQMDQMKKMGGLSNLLSMIPGVGNKMQGLDIDDGMMDKTAAIIYSMTKEERANPKIINASRKRRIAAGAGVPIAEVNRLCKQVQNQKQMMKQMSGMFGGKGGKRGGFKLPF